MNFEDLIGLVLTEITENGSQINMTCSDGRKFVMAHQQDCCEHVYIESITGDLQDLVGEPITFAVESTNDVSPEGDETDDYGISMWTFYKLATCKGWVDIRWLGSSNGYYGVGVSFYEVDEDGSYKYNYN
jgi:hypothetical protein